MYSGRHPFSQISFQIQPGDRDEKGADKAPAETAPLAGKMEHWQLPEGLKTIC